MVTNTDRNGVLIGSDANDHFPALPMLDGIDDQIAKHSLDAPWVDLGDTRRRGQVEPDGASLAGRERNGTVVNGVRSSCETSEANCR